MNIIAIIPARAGSKGIAKKNLVSFCKQPLFHWTIQNCLDSNYIDKIYVTTDDIALQTLDKTYKVEIIKRPSSLAQDNSSSEDALLHVFKKLEISVANNYKNIDYVVFPQITSPLRKKEHIDEAIDLIINEKADSLFSASELKDFCVWDDEKSITYDYKNRMNRQQRKPYYLENGSFYIFKPEILLKNENRLGGKIIKYLMPIWSSYEIDTFEDLEICEYYMNRNVLQ